MTTPRTAGRDASEDDSTRRPDVDALDAPLTERFAVFEEDVATREMPVGAPSDETDGSVGEDTVSIASPAPQGPDEPDASQSARAAQDPTPDLPPRLAAETPTGAGAPQAGAVPLYTTVAPAPRATEPIRPQGPSPATIVLGVIVLLVGAITIAVGVNMTSWFLPNVDLHDFTAYLFAGIGVLLSVLAIVWALAAHLRRRAEERTSRSTAKGEPIE